MQKVTLGEVENFVLNRSKNWRKTRNQTENVIIISVVENLVLNSVKTG
jgi:hypothetical protein